MSEVSINPQELAKILDTQPTQLDGDEESFQFNTKNGNIVNLLGNRVEIITPNGNSVSIDNLTGIYYFQHNKVFVAEHISGDNITEAAVFEDGRYDLRSWKLSAQIDFRKYSLTYAHKSRGEQTRELLADDPLLTPIIKTAIEKKYSALESELLMLLSKILNTHPNKPKEEDAEAIHHLTLLGFVCSNLDDLIGIEHKNRYESRNTQLYINLNNPETIFSLLNETISYLTWYKEESYTQKELLKAIGQYSSDDKVVALPGTPTKHKVQFNFTVNGLMDKMIAINCIERSYNAEKRIYSMLIEPSYGYHPVVAGKKFKLSFIDCVYISDEERVIEKNYHNKNVYEFTHWGENIDIQKDKLGSKFKLGDLKKYKMYSFGNLGLDEISILCKKTKTEIVE